MTALGLGVRRIASANVVKCASRLNLCQCFCIIVVKIIIIRKLFLTDIAYRHPISGKLLKGSTVLDYLMSPEGNLGMVATADDCMAWRKKTESFLFPGTEDDNEIPDGSRFFVGTYTFLFIPSDAVTKVS